MQGRESEPQAKLLLKSGSLVVREVPLVKQAFTIGRSLDSDLELIDGLVSRTHSKIVKAPDGRFRIYDLNSSNGTYVNEQLIKERELAEGDVVRIGNTTMEFRAARSQRRGGPGLGLDDAGASDGYRPTASVTLTPPKGYVGRGDTSKVKRVSDLRPDYTMSLVDPEVGHQSLVNFFKERKRGNEALSKESLHFFILFQLAKGINSASNLDELLDKTMDLIIDVLKAERGVLMLLQDEELQPRVVKQRSSNDDENIEISTTITNRVLAEKVAILTSDASQDPRLAAGQSIHRFHIRSALCVPLWDKDEVSGLIYVDSVRAGHRFTEDDQDLLTAVANQIAVALKQQELREQIKNEAVIRANLARFHSPDVINMILMHKESMRLGLQEKNVTVLFADIEGFTKLSEQLDPEVVADTLNSFFELMTSIVFKHRGTVNKFMGDCIMALWGAPFPLPNHAASAIRAGLQMLNEMALFRERHPEERRFNIRIGINSGPAMAGNLGSSKRMEYTVIGDTVNVAARLESAAQPNTIYIGEATADQVVEDFVLESLGRARLKGKEKEIRVYRVLSEVDGTTTRVPTPAEGV